MLQVCHARHAGSMLRLEGVDSAIFLTIGHPLLFLTCMRHQWQRSPSLCKPGGHVVIRTLNWFSGAMQPVSALRLRGQRINKDSALMYAQTSRIHALELLTPGPYNEGSSCI